MLNAETLFTPMLLVVLTFIRVGSLWMFFPILSQANIPMIVRVASGLTLSVALQPLVAGALPVWSLNAMPQISEVLYFVTREFLIGAGMGLVARWFFAAVMSGAQWVGYQMGFSQGSVMNPEFGQNESAWAEFHHWVAVILFFSIGGHWLMIDAVAQSYRFDMTHFFDNLLNPQRGTAFWIDIGSHFFVWMFKLSGPVVVVLLLLQAAMGVLSRFVPQINIWLVSIPVTIGVGVFTFAAISPMYGDVLGELFKSMGEGQYYWLKFVGVR